LVRGVIDATARYRPNIRFVLQKKSWRFVLTKGSDIGREMVRATVFLGGEEPHFPLQLRRADYFTIFSPRKDPRDYLLQRIQGEREFEVTAG
jgi:hypothetical protein